MKTYVKIAGGIILVVAVAVALWWNMSRPIAVNLHTVNEQRAELHFTEKGVVEQEDEVQIYPLVQGKILDVFVKENDIIQEGQPICTIDTTDVAFEIRQIEAQVSSMEAQKRNLDSEEQKAKDTLQTQKNQLLKELDAISAQESGVNHSKDEQIRLQKILIEQNKADLQRAKDDYQKLDALFNSGLVSDNDREAGEKLVQTLETQYNQNIQQLEVINAGNGQTGAEYFTATKNTLREQISGVNKNLGRSYTASMKDYYNAQIKLQQVNLEKLEKLKNDATITSPVSGTITSLSVEKTNIASSAVPVAVVATGKQQIVTYVSTTDLNAVTKGKEVTLTLKRREGDEIYKGIIQEIDNKAAIKISSLGLEERKVEVKIEPTEARDKFQLGYDCDVSFLVYEQENALIVPKTAIFKDGDSHYVWLVSGGKLRQTEIEEGQKLRSDTVIDNGLTDGSIIVADASLEALKEGLSVVAEK